jgi:hypothetical protein
LHGIGRNYIEATDSRPINRNNSPNSIWYVYCISRNEAKRCSKPPSVETWRETDQRQTDVAAKTGEFSSTAAAAFDSEMSFVSA